MRKPGPEYLCNTLPRDLLEAQISQESQPRVTLSFYRYLPIAAPDACRDQLFRVWQDWQVLGRVYLASEGINGQVSVPEPHYQDLLRHLQDTFGITSHRRARQEQGAAFLKLKIKVRPQIVADGLPEGTYDLSRVGQHLNASDWNQALAAPGTICVDMRNHYESEVGHFEGAVRPDCDTFREELPLVREQLRGKEDQKILLYCTGGIRCEKASAYLLHEGFTDVNQLAGGIISYAEQVATQGLDSRFKGKNFVFDDRLGERITADVISSCHQCGDACDDHTNCLNDDCHLLFIQCPRCKATNKGFCSTACAAHHALPAAAKKRWRAERPAGVYRSRLRPQLRQQKASDAATAEI